MHYFLEKKNIENLSPHTLLRLAELVFTQNCFKYADNYFSQTCGTVLGSSFMGEYSCLAVGKQESDVSETYYGPFLEFHK